MTLEEHIEKIRQTLESEAIKSDSEGSQNIVDTERKKALLEEIAAHLGVQLQIEIVKK